MTLLDTDTLIEWCSICGQLIDRRTFPEPIIIIGGGKIAFSDNAAATFMSNVSVMHRDCYYAQTSAPN